MEYPAYLDLIIQLVATNERPGKPLPAAALGNALRKAAPESSYIEFGKQSLREVLEDLQAQGRVTLTETDKGAFAVRRNAATLPTQVETYNPLHKAVWEAFTFTIPPGRRFLNRRNGSVRSGLSVSPTPADEWVEIAPITADTQRNWAVEFARTLDPGIRAAVESRLEEKNWSGYAFVTALREQSPHATRAWNKLRSDRVAAHVNEWLKSNGLLPACAFQQPLVVTKLAQGANVQSIPHPAHEQEVRSVILAALGQLPLADLLEIPIPVKLVLDALSLRKPR